MKDVLTIEECWKEGLLKNVRKNEWLVKKSVQTAKMRLTDAEQCLLSGVYNGTVFFAYMAMFHAAKAILFRDGVRERSHKCVVLYLKDRYVKNGLLSANLIHYLDSYRLERHNIVYGFDFFPKKDDGKAAIEDANEFIKTIEKILKQK